MIGGRLGFKVPGGGAVPVFRSASTALGNTVGFGGTNVSYPSGWQAGDLLVLFALLPASVNSYAAVSGATFTQVRNDDLSGGGNLTNQQWYRIAQSGDSGTINVGNGLSLNNACFAILAYRQLPGTVSLGGGAGQYNSGVNTVTIPSFTPTLSGFLLEQFSCTQPSGVTITGSPPAGSTSRATLTNTTTAINICEKDNLVGTSPTGTFTRSFTTGGGGGSTGNALGSGQVYAFS